MMTSIALIGVVVILEARPVYSYLGAAAARQAADAGSSSSFVTNALGVEPSDAVGMLVGFGLAAVICAAATIVPIRVALTRLEQGES
jgi:hypothetical protein